MSEDTTLSRRAKLLIARPVRRFAECLAQRDSPLATPIVRALTRRYRGRGGSVKRLPLEWLDDTTGCAVLEPARPAVSFGPHIDGDQPTEPIVLPAIELYRFDDALVCAGSSSVVLDGRVIVEGVPGVEPRRCDLAMDHVIMYGETTAYVATRPATQIDRGLFLGGNGAANYYHWMIEILPRLQFLSAVDGAAGRPVPILVSGAAARIASLAESLCRTAGEREVVEMAPGESYRVRELYYINAPSVCPFNLRRGERIRLSDFLIRPSSVRFVRDRLLGEAKRPGNRGDRLFLARPPIRRHYNQDEVLAVFARHGFVETYLEELSLADQIDVVAGADWLAGPSGAAWANLIFAPPGGKAICWMPDEAAEFAAYSNLATIAGVELRYVTYATRAGSTSDLYTTRYRIDPRRLESRLQAMLEAA